MSGRWGSPAGDKGRLLPGWAVVPTLQRVQICPSFLSMAKLPGCESAAPGYEELRQTCGSQVIQLLSAKCLQPQNLQGSHLKVHEAWLVQALAWKSCSCPRRRFPDLEKKQKKIKKSCLAFGKLSKPQISSWIDFLKQCGLSYVKHFLPAIAEGGRLDLEMPFPISPSKLVASDFFQYPGILEVLDSCSGVHMSSLDDGNQATFRQAFSLISAATWKMWDLIQKNSWAAVIYKQTIPSEGLHWPYKLCEWTCGLLPLPQWN